MEIKKVISDKKEFLELLLLADEQESMIDRYLERGDMFVLYDNGLKACCRNPWRGRNLWNQEHSYDLFFPAAGIWKTLDSIFIWSLSGEMFWNAGRYRRCTFYAFFLRTLWLHHFPSAKEFLYRQLRPSYVRRRQATGGYGISEKDILVFALWWRWI